MTVIPKPGDGTVTFKKGGEGKEGFGKTGLISCENSFTVEVKLLKGVDEDDD